MPSPPLYAAMLTPYRAMGPVGVRRVVAVMAGLALVPGLLFFSMGAWPVVGFMGLEVLALYWALSRSLRDGKAFEQVTLWPDALEIRAVTPKGEETTHCFNPFFVRFSVRRDREDRVVGLTLFTRDRALEIGAFLPPDDKAVFARDFGTALARANR